MAFRLPVHLEGYEYRAMRTGNGAKGPWMSIVIESPEDANQVDVSIPREKQAEIYDLGMSKGDVVTLDVIAFAGADYSRISLVEITGIVDKDGEVQL